MLRARLPLVVGLSLLSLPALAQTGNYDGAPQQGVEVQYRFTNPGQSQQILTAQPVSSTAVIQGDVRAGVEADYAGLRPSVDAEGVAMDLTDGVMELLGARGFSQTHAEDMPMTVGASSIYRGVTPDARDTLPHISPYQRAAEDGDDPNQLTWVGFQRFDDKARVFIQTGRPSQYRTTLSRWAHHHHRASRHAGRHVEFAARSTSPYGTRCTRSSPSAVRTARPRS